MYSVFIINIIIYIVDTALNIFRAVKKVTENDKKNYFKIEILFSSMS